MRLTQHIKTIRTYPVYKLVLAVLISAPVALTGCNSEDEETAATEIINQPTSSLLVDNPLSGNESFNNFTTTSLLLSVQQILADKQVSFSASKAYLKLSREDGELLFFGEVKLDQTIELPVNLPNNTRTVHYELVSDQALDGIVTGEITL